MGASVDFEFSADQETLRHTVRRYLADQAPVSSYVRAHLDDATGTSPTVWQGLADLGLLGLAVPERFGGAGVGMIELGVVLEEMGRVVHPGPFLSSAVGAVTMVREAGTEDDMARWLPGLARGSTVGTVAIMEPGRHRPSSRPDVTAELGKAGAWRLHGVKTPVADASAAGLLLVTATGPDGVGVFAVERPAPDEDMPGLVIEPMVTVDGTRRWARVDLDGVAAHRLNGNPGAADAVVAVRDCLLIAMVTDGVGAAGAALDTAVAYAKARVQFDKPIGSFQAVQHLCADMLQAVEQARAGAYYGLWAAAAASPAERHRAAVMAKAFAGPGLAGVGASTIQILGGIGFTWEHNAHLFYKRLLTLAEAYGGATEHLEDLATIVL
jgi:alkylation response protein AidB-like acyl-CoA dehydrogenase